jgi:hypothetical protein
MIINVFKHKSQRICSYSNNRGSGLGVLDTFKKKDPAQPQQEVPEELPDLPQGAAPAQEAAPDELPPVGELAPDELPPVGAGIGSSDLASQQDDRRLYFSTMLQKLHEEGIKSTKLTSPTANLLTDMKKHWKQRKRVEEIDAMRQKVAESLTPLQRLEQEWVSLQEEIEIKKQLLHEKEEEIRKFAEQAKTLALKADSMKADDK